MQNEPPANKKIKECLERALDSIDPELRGDDGSYVKEHLLDALEYIREDSLDLIRPYVSNVDSDDVLHEPKKLCIVMKRYRDANSENHVEALCVILGFVNRTSCELAQDYIDSLNIQKDKVNKLIRFKEDSSYKALSIILLDKMVSANYISPMLKEAILWGDTLQPNTEFYIQEAKVFP